MSKLKLKKLKNTEDFRKLKRKDDLLIIWNSQGEMWNKEMEGKKLYTIQKIQKGSRNSKYPDEIILRRKGNIFFNFRLFLNGESKIVKEVYLI